MIKMGTSDFISKKFQGREFKFIKKLNLGSTISTKYQDEKFKCHPSKVSRWGNTTYVDII